MKNILSKKIIKFFGGVVMAAVIAAISIPVYAVEDGAYTVGRTTSYVNPQTGETEDGGTNIALGDSMCASIVEQTALVEQYQGKTYVTLGLGLMSNISSVRIQIQGADGSYRDAALTQTGSCSRDGDTCNHYRFEVDSADNYISPVLYVTPMGRDVQFFVKLDMGSASAGTGNFVSEMIPAAVEAAAVESVSTGTAAQTAAVDTAKTTAEQISDAADTKTTETEEATEEVTEAETEEAAVESVTERQMTEETESLFPGETEEATEEQEEAEVKKKTSVWGAVAIIAVVIVVAAGIGYGIYRRKRM